MKQNRQLSRSRLCLKYLNSRPYLKATILFAAIAPLSLNVSQGNQIKKDLKPSNTLTVVAVQGATTVFQKMVSHMVLVMILHVAMPKAWICVLI